MSLLVLAAALGVACDADENIYTDDIIVEPANVRISTQASKETGSTIYLIVGFGSRFALLGWGLMNGKSYV